MDRRAFIGTFTGGLLAAPLAADGQPVGKVPRVCWLELGSMPPKEGLPHALRELGWVEGRNIAFEWVQAEGKAERLPALAAELLRRRST